MFSLVLIKVSLEKKLCHNFLNTPNIF